MKRRIMAKRRNRMLKADRAVEKRQLKGVSLDSLSREMAKLERAIDLLPKFNKPHKY